MWAAWLQRVDGHGHPGPNDTDRERDSVVWWLLYGQADYKDVWWFGPEQIEIAMEAVAIEGRTLPRLVRRLYLDRDDLRAAFSLVDADAVGDLLCWYRLSGPVEANVARACRWNSDCRWLGPASSRRADRADTHGGAQAAPPERWQALDNAACPANRAGARRSRQSPLGHDHWQAVRQSWRAHR
jgi:hypothetical protein